MGRKCLRYVAICVSSTSDFFSGITYLVIRGMESFFPVVFVLFFGWSVFILLWDFFVILFSFNEGGRIGRRF